ncbi:hypothetical protein, partial [Streptomyces sp. NPDC059538]|uniref:hypothetical protein n=1 Tax=Streptomyces sp. NPDC059538 TaxID=3346860 RepID=UPI0036B1B96A
MAPLLSVGPARVQERVHRRGSAPLRVNAVGTQGVFIDLGVSAYGHRHRRIRQPRQGRTAPAREEFADTLSITRPA